MHRLQLPLSEQIGSNNCFDRKVRQEIEAEKTQYNQNMKLLQWLTECTTKVINEAIIEALCETEQEHVANVITGNTNGESKIKINCSGDVK